MLEAFKEIFGCLWYVVGIVGACYLLFILLTTPSKAKKKEQELKKLNKEMDKCLEEMCDCLMKVIEEAGKENNEKKQPKKKTPKKD